MNELVERVAGRLSEAQRQCGDVLDRLPCGHCKRTNLRGCPVPTIERVRARDIINRTPGLHNFLLAARKEALDQ